MIHIAASPFSLGKRRVKAAMYEAETRRWGVPLVQVNLVGGNDNLIFDGWSNVWNGQGRVVAQAAGFAEDLLVVETGRLPDGEPALAEDGEEELYRALTLGVRDYVHKCGFRRVLIGLSGGIDSALTAAIAADALGPQNVVGVSMPSQYSSDHSREDAAALARNLGIELHTIPVEPIYRSFMTQLGPVFAGTSFGLAEENLQARVRGTLLMTLSNKFGWLVLSTGNKSEMAVGYCTLYGDMNGGLAVLADVLKTRVWALSRWVNRGGERIPRSSIDKPPSAELRPDQFDSDSLPPYEQLDPIVEAYVERMATPEEIVAQGHDPEVVRRILRMIDRTEYKRQQAALCLKVTTRAFGSGRRMPIARGD
jgi:NAD+ synthase (glutamine-hydrolysing)